MYGSSMTAAKDASLRRCGSRLSQNVFVGVGRRVFKHPAKVWIQRCEGGIAGDIAEREL